MKKNYRPYKDAALPVSKRVSDLMGRMSLTEKAAQLMGLWNGGVEDFKEEIFENPAMMKEIFGNGCHSVHPAPFGIVDTVRMRNRIQRYLVENTRLGIPALFVDEGQHGMMRPEATVFPQAIGMACSWDTALFEKIYGVIAHEMRARGTHHALTPVIDVCRDPRWGRVEETYGEDPYLNGMLSVAAVKGLQGGATGKVGKKNVAATLKHLAGHGESVGGRNQGPVNHSERILRDYHMPPFKMCIDMASPVSVMPSYNDVDGVPSHANRWLLRDILRREWGFKGMIVSDYYGVDQLFNKHYVCGDPVEAAVTAFNSGVQYEFPQGNMYRVLPEMVRKKKINAREFDRAVEQVLAFKFELGLFENPYVDEKEARSVSRMKSHSQAALKAAHESIVLLKNDGLLPLKKGKYKKIAVIGPCARDLWFGGYSGEPYEKVSLLEGITEKAGPGTEVLFSQGCLLTENTGLSYFNWKYDDIRIASRKRNLELIREATAVAASSDLIILAIGENEHLCREAWAKNHIGDNMSLELFGEQGELADAVISTGKPVVVYLMNGRPLSVTAIAEHVPAVIEGWYMGQETGTAAANIIFGDVNPSGKLTITFPKSAGQLPMYYNHKPSDQFADYISQDINPLYHFGYGLSYTTFQYSEPVLKKPIIRNGKTARVSVEVTNTGKIAGEEIVQLYIRDRVSSVTRPVLELKGFKRIALGPGEKRKVTFDITPESLAFHNVSMKFVVEPGVFDIMVGPSSRDEDLKTTELLVK